jgi:hypothetical protein
MFTLGHIFQALLDRETPRVEQVITDAAID